MTGATTDVDLVTLRDGTPSGAGAVIDVLDAANRLAPADAPPFRVRPVGCAARTELRGGFSLATTPLSSVAPAPVVFVVGLGSVTPQAIDERLREPDARRAIRWLGTGIGTTRFVGACTASFLLAEAGLLDDRRCTTTWWLTSHLATTHPRTEVCADEMVVRDGPVWTGGAAFSHIDLALELVEHHCGAPVAREVASRLAIDRRTIQADFSLSATTMGSDSPETQAIESLVLGDLSAPVTLESLSARLHLSPRTLHRRVQAASGQSPMQVVRRTRLRAALELLRTSSLSVAEIAATVGLSDSAALYRLTRQTLDRAPSQLR